MTKVLLELDSLTIDRPKKRWDLYFVVVAEHPTEADKMVVTTVPGTQPIKVTPNQSNVITFDAGVGSEGLLLLKREIPPSSRELNVHLHVMHSRRNLQAFGTILKDIEKGLSGQTFGVVQNILGTSSPWLSIAKAAMPLIGQILEKIPDRNMGFISMFERFGTEFENQIELDREKSGGYVKVVYSWAIDQ
jgi:hypothetical protein